MRTIFLFICVISTFTSDGQNLVKNPSFEDFVFCPNAFEYDTLPVKFWYSPYKLSTPDYFNECGTDRFRTPKNVFGGAIPRTGKAYIGIVPSTLQGGLEHITGGLMEPLIKGKRYLVKFYVYFAEETSKYSTYALGAYLSKQKIFTYKPNELFTNRLYGNYIDLLNCDFKAYVENPKGNFLTKSDWTEISGVYEAKGGELYITLGMFFQDDKKIVNYIKKAKKKNDFGMEKNGIIPFIQEGLFKINEKYQLREASKGEEAWIYQPYYYLDDVSVEEIKNDNN